MPRFFRLSRREFLLLVLLFVVSLPAVTTRIYASDEVQYFSYLRSLYFDHDVSFENEYRHFYDSGVAATAGFHDTFLVGETAAGRRVNYGTIGSAVLWAPFYAVADVWTRLSGRGAPDGFSRPYISAVAYASALYGFLAVLLSIRAARDVLGESGGAAAALAVWLGTPLLFYMYLAPSFAHAPSAFMAAVFVNVWLHVRRSWSPGGAFALGLCAGFMGTVREQDIFLALGPAVDFLWSRGAAALSRPVATAALAGVAGTALGLLPQLLAYKALNGYFGPAAHVARKMYWSAPFAMGVLGSPAHGFLVWTPLALLAIAGLGVMIAREEHRRLGLALLIMLVSQVYVAGSVASWTVAGAFGQRRFVCLTTVLTIGLAALVRWSEDAAARRPATAPGGARGFQHSVVLALVAMTVWWNVALMVQFATRLMDRQRLEPARNAYHAVVTVPQLLPSVAWRYLTDRESFYGPPAPEVP